MQGENRENRKKLEYYSWIVYNYATSKGGRSKKGQRRLYERLSLVYTKKVPDSGHVIQRMHLLGNGAIVRKDEK
jgi:ribosomal protein L32